MTIDVIRYEREQPRLRELEILAQDPSVLDESGRPLVAKVRVPYERLEPGPRGHRVHVVDYDATSGRLLHQPTELGEAGLVAPQDQDTLARDFPFHAQNAYAIVMRTLRVFETALGRRVGWGFDGHQIFVAPHALYEPNAFYAEEDRGLYFGYFDTARGRVLTCLSHDIVAHETTHALLDGLRDRFDTPGLPDQAAFHEALSDIVALLSAFSLPEYVRAILGRTELGGDLIGEGQVSEAQLRGVLTVAEQLGQYVTGPSARGLRNSLELLEQDIDWQNMAEFLEPHRRGEVLVAAVLRSFVRIWRRRLHALTIQQRLNRERAAEEGALAAEHLLRMCIRAIDYCPPLEFEFADFLDALIVSDKDVEPDDERGYRKALVASFQSVGIVQPEGQLIDLSRADRVAEISYDGLNYLRLRSDPDEVYRFLWQNRDVLCVDLAFHTEVEKVRPVVRVGSDGFVVSEVVVDYFQQVRGRPADLAALLRASPCKPATTTGQASAEFSPPVAPECEIELWGSGVLVFDQFGRAKYHQRKSIADIDRQNRRFDYLAQTGELECEPRHEPSGAGPPAAEFHLVGAAAHQTW